MDEQELTSLVGKTVAYAHVGQDIGGYDRFAIVFSDGTHLVLNERGQTGYIEWTLTNDKGEVLVQ